jgi:hypothetical protein
VEYPSLEQAIAAYSSAAYAEEVKALGGVGRDFRIIEGWNSAVSTGQRAPSHWG